MASDDEVKAKVFYGAGHEKEVEGIIAEDISTAENALSTTSDVLLEILSPLGVKALCVLGMVPVTSRADAANHGYASCIRAMSNGVPKAELIRALRHLIKAMEDEDFTIQDVSGNVH